MPEIANKPTGTVSSAEEILRLAAQSYFGKVHGATDLALLTAGVVAPLRLLRYEEMLRAGVETATSIANFGRFETAYNTTVETIETYFKERRLTPAHREDLLRYLKNAFEEAGEHSVAPTGWCDTALRAIYSYATTGHTKISIDVANKLKGLVTAFRELGNWRVP